MRRIAACACVTHRPWCMPGSLTNGLLWRRWRVKRSCSFTYLLRGPWLSNYIFECVSKIKHIPSIIRYTICGAVCFQFTHFPCDSYENIYTLSYYHHQIGSMSYYPLFRVRSWNNGMRCMYLYIHIPRCYVVVITYYDVMVVLVLSI